VAQHQQQLIGCGTERVTHEAGCFQRARSLLDALADRRRPTRAAPAVVPPSGIVAKQRPALMHANCIEAIDLCEYVAHLMCGLPQGYPDGRIEIRVNGAALPCVPYDRLSEIDQAAVVDNKRLGHPLQMAQVIQAQRDDRRASGLPSRTNQGEAPRVKERKAGTRKQRELTLEDLNAAVLATAGKRIGSVLKSPSR
jgi:hypothetical protein